MTGVVSARKRSVAIYGQTVQVSGGCGETPIPRASAFSTGLGVVLGQEKVASTSNEITVIPNLRQALSVNGLLVSIKAVKCQKSVPRSITEQGGDSSLTVKGNQPMWREAVESEVMDRSRCDAGDHHGYARKPDGRIFRRIASIVPAKGIIDLLDWPKCRKIGLVDFLRQVGSKESSF